MSLFGGPRGPRPERDERAAGASERIYRLLLRAYPRELRDEYADEMARLFRDLCREALEDRGGPGLAALWARTVPELLYTALKERSMMSSRSTCRSVAGVAFATVFVLLIPLLAGAPWSLFDFVVAGALVFGTGLAYLLVVRKTGSTAYRVAVAAALAPAFLLVWVNGAVGIIGSEDNPANLLYAGVLAVWALGIVIARFRTVGMARALFVAGLAQALVPVIALIVWTPQVFSVESSQGVLHAFAVNAFFVALFIGSALLFRYAGRQRTAG